MIRHIYNDVSVSGELSGTMDLADETWGAKAFNIREVRLHVPNHPMASGEFRVDLDSNEGDSYDAALVRQDVTGIKDYVQTFDIPIACRTGDKINYACTSSGEDNTYGFTCVYEEV